MNPPSDRGGAVSRRHFLKSGALSAAALASARLIRADEGAKGPARQLIPLDEGWRFGGELVPAALSPGFDDSGYERICLPHSAAKLSWQEWKPEDWERQWIYRRHFPRPQDAAGRRVFVEFDGVMVGAAPVINGRALPPHLGGYLPFRHEITRDLVPGDNVLAVAVDSRWSQVPPEGSPAGPKRVDYLEAGGIYRSVRLAVVPPIYVRDVFAKPAAVLAPDRRLEIACTIDAGVAAAAPVTVTTELRDGARVVARHEETSLLAAPGEVTLHYAIFGLGAIELWDVDAPKLYDVVTTLKAEGQPLHEHRTRVGFRDAQFTTEGFFLNGRRRQLFGLNRHEIYPYVGGAMPRRVLRREAEMLRRDFHVNIVRCSHYPQSEEFLDACDELGLMVWEETPGWGYLGDEAWKELVVRDVGEMIRRDRNHPAIVIWGVRVNESPNDVPLYLRTTALARELDGSRPTSGSMTGGTRKSWQTSWVEDVFAYDDYHEEADGTVGIEKAITGHPYLLAEAVGQYNYARPKHFDAYYRRVADLGNLQSQGLRHAQAHSRAANDPRNCGVIAWCAFDYASLVNAFHNVKTPGICDVFRIPKLGAGFYLTQGGAAEKPMVVPDFYWDFGPASPRGPGRRAAIFSNCDRLECFLEGKALGAAQPAAADYPHLAHPPFFFDLEVPPGTTPELRIDGFVGGKRVISRSFSGDRTQDRLVAQADDAAIAADGSDATRVAFRVLDRHGAERNFAEGDVTLSLSGPGTIVGDTRISLALTGGVGAVWVRGEPGKPGTLTLALSHPRYGQTTATILSQ